MERKNMRTMENMDIMLILTIRHILQNEQVLELRKHMTELPEFPPDLLPDRSLKEYFRHRARIKSSLHSHYHQSKQSQLQSQNQFKFLKRHNPLSNPSQHQPPMCPDISNQ